MLKFLSIRDFVIVSKMELEFSGGFTALTGETGAGKSILIDALLLALGERGDASMVRNGCERAEITAEFDIGAMPVLQGWLAAQELAGDEGVCLMRRLLEAGGRSRGFINGRSATLQQMREAGEQLLNIHGQHAHQTLLQSDEQRFLLDGYGRLQENVTEVARLYRDWQALKNRRIALSENSQAAAALGEPLQLLDSAQAELQEAVYSLRHYQQRLDTDPQQLLEKEQKIQAVMDMARKYRVPPERLDEVLQGVVARLAELGGDIDLEQLMRQEQAAQQAYRDVAGKLSAARGLSAEKLSLQITQAMQTLAMQGGSFAVVLLPLPEGSASGLETVEFQVAANPGTPTRSMAKVASGGELSRISLAIQVATSQIASVPTLIFDEVDSGIGGRVAEIVGLLLKQLGRDYQVLCVTHLPQVAAMADGQWQVSKAVEAGVTLSHIEVLDDAQRIEEIARMLGGVVITETTRQHAAEMLGLAA
jgi:DNA repair protein RecN (Recombination protein N)